MTFDLKKPPKRQLDMPELLRLLCILRRGGKKLAPLLIDAGLSRSTFFRRIADWQSQVGVVISFDAQTRRYVLVDPGVIDLSRL